MEFANYDYWFYQYLLWLISCLKFWTAKVGKIWRFLATSFTLQATRR